MGNYNSVLLGAAATLVGGFVIYRIIFSSSGKPSRLVALVDPLVKYPFELVHTQELTHDTRLMRFALPTAEHVLGLPVGQHIYLSARINGDLVVRPYTPTSSDEDKGHFDLVLKIYKANVNPRFPDGGKLTPYLDAMKPGDKIDVRGPSGRLTYQGCGRFQIRTDKKSPAVLKHAKQVGMICGGTGITPMYQLIKYVCNHPEDTTKLSLLFANQTQDDILLRDELEELARKFPDRLQLWFTVDRSVQPDWKFDIGFVNEEMIREHMPAPSSETLILMCGPPPMINYACVPNLEKVGFTSDMRFVY